MLKILDLQTAEDSRDIVHRSVQALVEGQLVGLPTETSYAVAAHALCEPAMERLCALAKSGGGRKGDERSETDDSPGVGDFALSIRSREAAIDYLGDKSTTARRLMHRCWPGPLTIQCECRDPLSAISQLPEFVRNRLICQENRINFRVVDHDVLDQIHRYLSAPLVLFSHSNCNYGEVVATAATLADRYSNDLPLLLDDGPTRYGGRTTVVQVNGNRWKLLREGVIERAAMNQFVKPVIALVCTGNTCRSPMAETIMREQLRKRTGCEDAVRVLSAGVAASAGSGASPHAVAVMGKRGLDLTGHSSRPLDESVMNVADLVLTMTRGHRAAILAAWPEMHDRIFTLRRDGGDISDPVGMDIEVYRACADQIEEELGKWLDSLDDDFFPKNENEPNNKTNPDRES
ncbi:Low molecular weight protein-tyrosine-phosphatase YwlE [Novipirellula aureliae]|uniref:L-threonylcarbamoyladenylate synthase n=1 Tax=Novipirellula aureliae TaxID=2527966 RepID=A0A5C6E540_9BACT|nr:Sua5/YciO/YrdC/YwlC family protein [Novipirellula aureliae]TWU43805.1 Low molecular weight protein-tyrosine-phosphatase YwlE [Novipirellula aureliae]